MRLIALLSIVGTIMSGGARADDLATAPATAQKYAIISTAGKHGSLSIWTDREGTRWSRESILFRSMITETEQQIRYGKDGMIRSLSVRGVTPTGPADENFVVARDEARWTWRDKAGVIAYTSPAFYLSYNGTGDSTATLIEALYAVPGKQLPLLPSGNARLEPLTSLTVGKGKMAQTVSCFVLAVSRRNPVPVWVDSKGKFFALADDLAWLPEGYEDFLPALLKTQNEAMTQKAATPADAQRSGF